MRDKTIRLRRSKIILGIISLLLCYAPLLVALITGFSYSDNERGKVTLSICCTVALLLTLINIISKYSVRSTMWVLLLGAYAVLEDVMPYLHWHNWSKHIQYCIHICSPGSYKRL